MRPSLILTTLLLVPLLGMGAALVAADGPTMSSLNDPQSATPPAAAPPAAAPASAPDATTPASAPAPAPVGDASAGGPIQHAVVPPAAAPVTADAPAKKGRRDRSNIARAAKALDAAIAELNRAPDDFGGHKADAIKACEAARDELKQAVAYRAEHPLDPTAPK